MTLQQYINVIVALKELKDLMDLSDEEERKSRRFWVNPFLDKRLKYNLEALLLKDVIWENTETQNYNQMNINDFEKILSVIEHKIKKQDTVMRLAITPRVRLAVTLRFICKGDSYRCLECICRISRKTISAFIPEVLDAIVECLEKKYLKLPSTAKEWRSVANGFRKRLQFPHTLGAIDGKHIRIKAPTHSEGDFSNNKGFYSIVLLAVVDSISRFIYIDVGGNGRVSDDVILESSSLYESMRNGLLDIPPAAPLPGQEAKTPFFFIGDDIFALDDHMMKAYSSNSKMTVSQKIFNYRLSRSRISVDLAFGKLTDRFKIFCRPLEIEVKTCDLLLRTCCILHNYLTKPGTVSESVEEEIMIPALPETFTELPPQRHENAKTANQIRENIKKYLVTDGDVTFQWNTIKKNR